MVKGFARIVTAFKDVFIDVFKVFEIFGEFIE